MRRTIPGATFGFLGWGVWIASRGGGRPGLPPPPQLRGSLPPRPRHTSRLTAPSSGRALPRGRSGGTGALGPRVARPPPIAPASLLSRAGAGGARGEGGGWTEVAQGRAPSRGPPSARPPHPRPIAAAARPTSSRGHSPGAPRPSPARRACRRPRGPQEAPRPPAPPAAPSALRPRQALPGSERGRPRAAAGAAGTCSSPASASAVAIAAPASPRASLCPGPATRPRGRAFVCAAPRPRCPRRGLSSSTSLSAALDPSPPLPLSLCSFSVALSLYFYVSLHFSLFASLALTFSTSVPLCLYPLLSPCLCLLPGSLVSRNTEHSLSVLQTGNAHQHSQDAENLQTCVSLLSPAFPSKTPPPRKRVGDTECFLLLLPGHAPLSLVDSPCLMPPLKPRPDLGSTLGRLYLETQIPVKRV